MNTALDNDYARHGPQRRTVLHPCANFGGINTDHYETYDSTRRILQEQSDVFMPTEFLHGLYDGGAGAGLDDCWKLMGHERLSAGGFLWSLVDEGIVRDDLDGTIDVAGNAAPDGILGPFREKEASFYTIKGSPPCNSPNQSGSPPACRTTSTGGSASPTTTPSPTPAPAVSLSSRGSRGRRNTMVQER